MGDMTAVLGGEPEASAGSRYGGRHMSYATPQLGHRFESELKGRCCQRVMAHTHCCKDAHTERCLPRVLLVGVQEKKPGFDGVTTA